MRLRASDASACPTFDDHHLGDRGNPGDGDARAGSDRGDRGWEDHRGVTRASVSGFPRPSPQYAAQPRGSWGVTERTPGRSPPLGGDARPATPADVRRALARRENGRAAPSRPMAPEATRNALIP